MEVRLLLERTAKGARFVRGVAVYLFVPWRRNPPGEGKKSVWDAARN
jgi:hypothetical protein